MSDQRHHDYVLGPNQDTRLGSVAAGAVIRNLELVLDPDAPFQLRSRALYCQYNTANGSTQSDLAGLKTRWSGPTKDYRHQGYVAETIQTAYFGQFGNPKPLARPIDYPAQGVILVDVYNAGATAITNLTFVWRGVKLFAPGSLPQANYPARFAAMPFPGYNVLISQLAVTETRYGQIFTVRQDADFVVQGGQFSAIASPNASKNVSLVLKDQDRKPYSNDFVRADVLFGCAAATTGMLNYLASGVSLVPPFLTGPSRPGLLYPQLYIPANRQLFFDILRDDSVITGSQTLDYVLNFIGQKVFSR